MAAGLTTGEEAADTTTGLGERKVDPDDTTGPPPPSIAEGTGSDGSWTVRGRGVP